MIYLHWPSYMRHICYRSAVIDQVVWIQQTPVYPYDGIYAFAFAVTHDIALLLREAVEVAVQITILTKGSKIS